MLSGANRRNVLIVILIVILVLTLPFLDVKIVSATNGEILLDSYSTTNYDTDSTIRAIHPSSSSAPSGIGQTFTTPDFSYTLTSAQFYLKKYGFPDGVLVATLYEITGSYGSTSKPTGSALATSDAFSMASLTTSYGLKTLSFSGVNRYVLIKSHQYAICIQAQSAVKLDSTNYVMVGGDISSPTHGGNDVYFYNSAWFASSGIDTIFSVYGVLNPFVTFYHNDGGVVLFDGLQRANGSSLQFLNQTYVLVAGPSNSSLLFLNFTYDSTTQTTNPYNYTVAGNVTIWTYFGIAVGPYIIARFSWSPANPTINEAVSFDGTLSNSSSEITSYVWAFGDGETGTGSTTVHSYDSAGAKTVTLTVESSVGTDAFSSYVVVGSGVSAEEGSSAGSHVFAPTPNALPWFVGQIVTGAGAIALLDYLNKKIRKIEPQKVKKRIHTVIKKAFTRREWDHVEN